MSEEEFFLKKKNRPQRSTTDWMLDSATTLLEKVDPEFNRSDFLKEVQQKTIEKARSRADKAALDTMPKD